MKLIVNLKLKPLESQSNALLETLKESNKACNWISERAFENKTYSQFHLHKIVYKPARELFNLSSQMIIRQIAKVSDSYQIKRDHPTVFKPLGSISYDDRIISFKKKDLVSIWTVKGRLNIPFVMGDYQQKLFQYRKGEVDLIYRKGQFFLNCVCDVPEDSPLIPDDILGIDFGITNLAASSDGQPFTGAEVERVRQKRFVQRQILQHKASEQSKAGKRPRSIHKLLKRLSGREKRFRQIENHRISKTIVSVAKGTTRGLALENLKGIRTRIEKRFHKNQRAKVSGWSFYQLKEMIVYKAKLRGVPVYFVDPKHTSQTCSQCGHCEKANRKSQSEFVCVKCNHSQNADINASQNIRGKAIVTMSQKSKNIVLSNAVQVQV